MFVLNNDSDYHDDGNDDNDEVMVMDNCIATESHS